MKQFGIVGGLLLYFLNPSVASTVGDWPQWRGPNRDGLSAETGLLDKWPSEGPPLIWKTTGLGEGYTAPSIVSNRIYGYGYQGEDEVVWVLDSSNGDTIWSTRVAPAYREIEYSEGPRGTPTVDGDLIFVLGAAGNLTCLETETGKFLWTRSLTKDLGGKMMSEWGYSESLLVDGNHLICMPGGSNGTVAALNKKSGELVWQSKELTDPASYSSLIKVKIGEVDQYIALTGTSLAGVASDDGRVLWRTEREGNTSVVATPIFKDNHIWVSSYRIGSHCFKVISENGKFSVEEAYTSRRIRNHHGGGILIGNHIYTTTPPSIVCIELTSGEVAWKERSVGEGSLAYADGHIYLRSERGPIALIEANPETYVEKSRFDQPDRSKEKSWAHPIISGGRLYLRDMDALFCYDIKKK